MYCTLTYRYIVLSPSVVEKRPSSIQAALFHSDLEVGLACAVGLGYVKGFRVHGKALPKKTESVTGGFVDGNHVAARLGESMLILSQPVHFA